MAEAVLTEDLYRFEELLDPSEAEILGRVRDFLAKNADIVLEGCRVPEENRLAHADGFRHRAAVLRQTRSGVAWEAAEVMLGAYRIARDYADEQSSLAKAYCTARMRENVAWGREILGGNGIVLDYGIGRMFADAEALYSYEGTREINTLIAGRALTGLAAFV
jgi:glutaryl-CoA dehydrogenase